MSQSGILDAVYAAAVEPRLWTTALAELADLLGGSAAWLSRLNVVDGSGDVLTTRIDPVMTKVYFEHFADRNPLANVQDPAAYLSAWTPSVLTDEDWMPKAALMGSEFYNDFMRPQAVHSTLFVRLAADAADVSVLNVARPPAAGQFSKRAIERARALQPHIIRAFKLSRTLAIGTPSMQGLADAFDGSPHALLVINRHGMLRRLNPAAEAVLARTAELEVTTGRLTAAAVDVDAQLGRLVAAAAERDINLRRGGSIVIKRSMGRPLFVSVTPVRAETIAVLGGEPHVLVCIVDPDRNDSPPAQRLRDLFGLTRSEARVALQLIAGATAREAAEQLGVSHHTVRAQTASIFEKAGVSRQGELVALVMRTSSGIVL